MQESSNDISSNTSNSSNKKRVKVVKRIKVRKSSKSGSIVNESRGTGSFHDSPDVDRPTDKFSPI